MQVLLSKEVLVDRMVCRWFLAAACTAGIILGAFVRIPLPFTPVPVTLQTFFVLLTGALLDRRSSTVSVAAYLMLGIAGVPVFSGASAGFAVLGGPTAGYLLGFIPAVALLSRSLAGRRANLIQTLVVLGAAAAVILICGCLWLKLLLGLSFRQALVAGVLPFLPGEAAKIGMAACIYRSTAARINAVLGA